MFSAQMLPDSIDQVQTHPSHVRCNLPDMTPRAQLSVAASIGLLIIIQRRLALWAHGQSKTIEGRLVEALDLSLRSQWHKNRFDEWIEHIVHQSEFLNLT